MWSTGCIFLGSSQALIFICIFFHATDEGGLSRRYSRHSQHSKRSSLGSGHGGGAPPGGAPGATTTTQADVLAPGAPPGASPAASDRSQQRPPLPLGPGPPGSGVAQQVAAAAAAAAMVDQHLGVERRLSQISDNEVRELLNDFPSFCKSMQQ